MTIVVTGGSGFIGTNLVDRLTRDGIDVVNVDIAPPKKSAHDKFWCRGDILDRAFLSATLESIRPRAVIHLAARTDVLGTSLDDYKENTQGTTNVVNAVRSTSSVRHLIVTSTQFVHQYSGGPKSDEDYAPHTVYGESKVITEQTVRQAGLSTTWTIIRPTNIWGPWHPRYPLEFWRAVATGTYVHPGRRRVMRSYGYVGTVNDQICGLLAADPVRINGRVFYVSDPPIDLYSWVNEFSIQQTGRPVKVVPRAFVKALALAGEAVTWLGIAAPLTLSRFRSMTTDNPDIPLKRTFDVVGQPATSLGENVASTVAWLREVHPQLVRKYSSVAR